MLQDFFVFVNYIGYYFKANYECETEDLEHTARYAQTDTYELTANNNQACGILSHISCLTL